MLAQAVSARTLRDWRLLPARNSPLARRPHFAHVSPQPAGLGRGHGWGCPSSLGCGKPPGTWAWGIGLSGGPGRAAIRGRWAYPSCPEGSRICPRALGWTSAHSWARAEARAAPKPHLGGGWACPGGASLRRTSAVCPLCRSVVAWLGLLLHLWSACGRAGSGAEIRWGHHRRVGRTGTCRRKASHGCTCGSSEQATARATPGHASAELGLGRRCSGAVGSGHCPEGPSGPPPHVGVGPSQHSDGVQ